MDPLKKLMESNILDDETKTIIREAFDDAVNQKTTELKEQYEQENGEVSPEVLAMIEESVSNELEPLKEEIEYARTLDVQYAEKFEDFKQKYHENQEAQMNEEVQRLVAEEFDELRESIETAKQNEFGRKIYEDYRDYFANNFGEQGVDAAELRNKLDEANAQLDEFKREQKINELLEGVTGRTRNVARTILEGVSVDKMDQRFESVKNLLLTEEAGTGSEETITEGANDKGEGKKSAPNDGDTLVIESSTNGNEGDGGKTNPLVERSLRRR